MQYRINPRNGEKISALGLGCMRFPGPPGHPDHKQVRTLIAHAYDWGSIILILPIYIPVMRWLLVRR